LVRQLLTFARQETVSPKTMDLNRAIDDLLVLRKELVDDSVRLTWAPGPETPLIKADPGQIEQILEQLVRNAQEAVLLGGHGHPATPEIRISTGHRIVDEETSRRYLSVAPGVFARIEVTDNGCGLAEHLAPLIFEPFFTTKQDSMSSGLGLSTVEGIARQNGGFVEVVSVLGKGSSFQVSLPSQTTLATAPPPRAEAVLTQGREKTVLLVDDEPALLRLCKRRLTRLGYHVLDAEGPGQALEVAVSHPGPIDLLLSDVMMPEMNGRELAQALQEARPGLPAIFMSGYAADVLARSGVLPPGIHFLAKPFSDQELQEKLGTVLGV
jgi:CheY-like chemotaxis protein